MKKALLSFLGVGLIALIARQTEVFPLLKSTVWMGWQPEGFVLVASHQLLRPWGTQTLIAGRPVDMAVDAGRNLLAVLNTRGVLLLDASTGVRVAEMQTRSTSYAGVAFRPGSSEIWASETSRNGPDSIVIGEIDAKRQVGKLARVDLTGHPVPATIAFSHDGKTAYVAFSRNNSVAVFDASARKLLREIEVGLAPFNLVVDGRRNRLFVTNRGGARPRPSASTAPSSGTQVMVDSTTGSTNSGTLSVIDLAGGPAAEIRVGLAPSNLALSADGKTLVVANSHSDSVSVVDTATLRAAEHKLPSFPEGSFGSQPVAAAFSPDGSRLYVACAGTNSIAVLTRSGKSWKMAGALPTGWFPSAVTVDADGSLHILNIKGMGSTAGKDGTFNSRNYEGSLVKIPAPLPPQLSAGLREVTAANQPRFEAAGGVSDLASLGIEHVFFIIKENRTYDQVFGDMGKGNGDPKLVHYGRDITPNHHALAERYVLLDNFYTGGAISFDGHQWLMQAFVSDYVERAFAASPRGYAWNMADALTIAPTGFFWQFGPRPLELRLYGEFCLPARWDAGRHNIVDIDESDLMSWTEYWRLYKQNQWREAVGSRSGIPALQRYVSARYPVSSTLIPDQIRVQAFLEEFAEYEKSGWLPNLMIFTMTADHTNGTRPGSPTPRAMVADNDLALGRIVEAVSKSRFWAKSLILTTEDDAQNGPDHVDGRRTIGLAIGPHVRRGALDSNHYTHGSMVRTIQEIFHVPARTRYLRTARAMTSVFTRDADLSPYKALEPKVALDEMNPPLAGLDGRRRWAAQQSLAMNWHEVDDIPYDVLNRILWWESKGYGTPYPGAGKRP